MTIPDTPDTQPHDRRRYPRYYVFSRLMVAIEDETLKESIGIGEPGDISFGGLRIRNLPAGPHVKVGDKLGLLLLDQDDSLSLSADVVHHGTPDTFGVEFRELTTNQQRAVEEMITRLHSRL